MSHRSSKIFTESDLSRIKAAVQEAEGKTSGEIVPYVVDQSDVYEEAEWRAGLLFGAGALVAFTVVHRFTTAWLPFDIAEMALTTLVAAAAGLLLVRYVESFKRFFAGKHLMKRRVHQRATEAFVSEEVFDTQYRTGILIFISLLERQVLVVGDSGINAKVKSFEWEEIVQIIVTAIREGKPADGVVEAIKKCGILLQKEGVAIRPDDKNELPDNLRLGDDPT